MVSQTVRNRWFSMPEFIALLPIPLAVIAVGCLFTVPAIAGYTIFSYRVFSGKVRELQYA